MNNAFTQVMIVSPNVSVFALTGAEERRGRGGGGTLRGVEREKAGNTKVQTDVKRFLKLDENERAYEGCKQTIFSFSSPSFVCDPKLTRLVVLD